MALLPCSAVTDWRKYTCLLSHWPVFCGQQCNRTVRRRVDSGSWAGSCSAVFAAQEASHPRPSTIFNAIYYRMSELSTWRTRKSYYYAHRQRGRYDLLQSAVFGIRGVDEADYSRKQLRRHFPHHSEPLETEQDDSARVERIEGSGWDKGCKCARTCRLSER